MIVGFIAGFVLGALVAALALVSYASTHYEVYEIDEEGRRMICSKCGGSVGVTDVNHNVERNETYRRRKCKVCGHVMWSIEFEVDNDENFREQWNAHDRAIQANREKRKRNKK